MRMFSRLFTASQSGRYAIDAEEHKCGFSADKIVQVYSHPEGLQIGMRTVVSDSGEVRLTWASNSVGLTYRVVIMGDWGPERVPYAQQPPAVVRDRGTIYVTDDYEVIKVKQDPKFADVPFYIYSFQSTTQYSLKGPDDRSLQNVQWGKLRVLLVEGGYLSALQADGTWKQITPDAPLHHVRPLIQIDVE